VTVAAWLAVMGLVILLALLAWTRWRQHHRPKLTEREASMRRWVCWVAARWGWDARNLGLALVDDTTRYRRHWYTGRVLPPVVQVPRARFEPMPNGIRARMATLPGVGLGQVVKMADHLANAWGCIRVDVTQDGPGQLVLRGHLCDPLAASWTVIPDGQPLSGWQLHVGVDEDSAPVLLPLANLSGITVAGVPGTGKTSLQRWWLCQLAPHPAVQIAVLDGKVSEPIDGDYGLLLSRCFAAAGDELDQANELLGRLHGLMRARSTWLRSQRGTAQFWEDGPSEDCPLVVVICDESHTFVTGASRKDREFCDSNIWYLTKLAKEGRSRGFLTVFVTQKQTADAIPTAIRDVCQVGLSFGVRTMDGAVAALGDEIRQYPEIAPTKLIGQQWTGVAITRLFDRAGYHRIRTPYVSEGDAAELVAGHAHLLRAPRAHDLLERGAA
jgi:S-DNA-T family DNA segregation ATPase FtsK/SpoIIIE